MERENVAEALSAFALGAVAGAAVALLYAPRAGDETRAMIGETIRRGTDIGRQKLREGAEFAREKMEQGADYGRRVAERVAGHGQEIPEEAADLSDAAGPQASSFVERRRKPRSV